MKFRYALQQDLPTIVTIYNSTIASKMVTADTAPISIESRQQWFEEHSQNKYPLWMVEEDEKNILGWVSLQPFYKRPAYDATAEISIYVDEKYRGKGYGKKILQQCFDIAPTLGITNLLGFIFEHNLPSLQLFTALGFEEWAHLKNIAHLDGVARSVKILGKHLNK